MQEKIEKPEIGEVINLEQTKEGQDDNRKIEAIKESNEPNKEDLLKKIYNKDDVVSAKLEIKETNDVVEKKVDSFVKEFRIFGSKVIGKARKALGAYGLDELHDKIVDENKNINKK
ncbi:MAG TPA: hypothetical protein PLD14_02165 [Candidatus Pacearchaeota archaeon]|nr:hypothetical protein [Candidatus Pacearchaeota archaeon]HPR80006.1 hypothetical protein [Candidatus Pacearchaeota archaeon]